MLSVKGIRFAGESNQDPLNIFVVVSYHSIPFHSSAKCCPLLDFNALNAFTWDLRNSNYCFEMISLNFHINRNSQLHDKRAKCQKG